MATFHITCTLEVEVLTDGILCQDPEDWYEEAYNKARVKYKELQERFKQSADVREVYEQDIEFKG